MIELSVIFGCTRSSRGGLPVAKWAEAPARAHGAFQALSNEWAGKVAGIVSYGGVSGGLRAAEALRQLLAGWSFRGTGTRAHLLAVLPRRRRHPQ